MTNYIMRHGESMATLDQSLFGRADPATIPVSQWGYEQAVEAGRFMREKYDNDPELKGRKLVVFCAPHTRIKQSMEGFLKGFGKEHLASIHIEPLIREREYGIFNGLANDEKQAVAPEIFEAITSKNNFKARYFTKIPGGESLEDVGTRLNKFEAEKLNTLPKELDALVLTHGDKCILLETHLAHPDLCYFEIDPKVPPTGSIIKAGHEGIESETIFTGKKRPPALKDYKTLAYQPNGFGVRAFSPHTR